MLTGLVLAPLLTTGCGSECESAVSEANKSRYVPINAGICNNSDWRSLLAYYQSPSP
jgi:hypothetical protein